VLEIAREGICRHNADNQLLPSLSARRGLSLANLSAEDPLSWIFYDLACAALRACSSKIVKILSPPQGGR